MFVFKPKLDRKDHSILDKPSSLLYSKGNLEGKISWNQAESMRILERVQLFLSHFSKLIFLKFFPLTA